MYVLLLLLLSPGISTLCQILSSSSLCCMSLHVLTVCVHDRPGRFELQRSVKLYTTSNVTETTFSIDSLTNAGCDFETKSLAVIPKGKFKRSNHLQRPETFLLGPRAVFNELGDVMSGDRKLVGFCIDTGSFLIS